MNKNPIAHLIIAGRGFTPVLTALFLQKTWGALAPRITLLECGKNSDPPIINSVSSIKGFHKELGIAEKDFVRKTEASFHLGTLYQFSDGHPEFFMSEAPYGVNLQAIRFNHWFTRYLNAGQRAQFDDFCLNAQLAKRGRFAPTSPKPESVYSQICYGYKLLSEHYRNYLLAQLEPRIEIVCGEIREVQTDLNGIHEVHLADGKTVAADFYIDCSKEHILKRSFAGTPKESAGETWHCEDEPECGLGPPHNHLAFANEKLVLATQLHGKTYHQESLCNTGQPPQWLLDPQPWQKNCLTFGPATSDRPALLIDPIHLVASGLYRLYNSWPTTTDFRTAAAIYNESFADEWNRIADSDSLHAWAACNRNDECLTDAAKHRLRIFSNDGRIPPYENETMTEDQWAALFFAFGVTPQIADPLTEGSDDRWLLAQLDKLKETLHAAAEHAPGLEGFYRNEVIR
jgi:tryptophan halogenase